MSKNETDQGRHCNFGAQAESPCNFYSQFAPKTIGPFDELFIVEGHPWLAGRDLMFFLYR